ncbi:SDR family oxidoreductase [Polynucleobacter nymphae]|uniref:SDR family oxidoreductase n=1 Tax=Polynucleobacter nymphae TaxID=2081043 RepID=UPI001C0E62B8|nr:SDR family oxidoreductase [Polynucleobacter nymphae]MBU3606994.1 SDR family oxidoreductase [Polynucleobacter nymphae]
MEQSTYALVTGASKGIGRAISDLLIEEGQSVIGIARNPDPTFKGKLFLADLSDAASRKQLFKEIATSFPIDRLVNNIGFNQLQGLSEITAQNYQKIIDLNLTLALELTQAVLPSMLALGEGRIVNIASRSMLGRKNSSVYAAAKAGLVGFTKSWALELAPSSITVNCVAPGPIATEMFDRNNPTGSPGRKSMMDSIPMNRLGDPREVAAAVSYFLSKGASFTTGQTIFVCGGASISQQHF